MKKCIICGHATPTIVRADYPGYVEGINFDIISCGQCNTHFISPIEVDPQIYELVYSDTSIAGYDRYFAYANSVKSKSDPLDFLAQSECTYYAVASFLKGKTGKKILEVGCGYGYLTYSMNQNGHQTTGIDSSAKRCEPGEAPKSRLILFQKNSCWAW